MIRASEYCTGWMDSSVHRFLADLDFPASSMKFALITCIDSSFDVVAMFRTSAALKALAPQSEAIGKGMLVSTARLLTAARSQQIFHGFDEIWFFPSPDVSEAPADLHYRPEDASARPARESRPLAETQQVFAGTGRRNGPQLHCQVSRRCQVSRQ